MKTILEIVNQSKDIRYSILFRRASTENNIKRVSRVEEIERRYIRNIERALFPEGCDRKSMSFKELDTIDNIPMIREVYMNNN